MILICPSCQTRYVLSDASIGETGRNVRCRACGHSWFARPPEALEPENVIEDDTGLSREQVERLRQKAQMNADGKSGPHAQIREQERKKRERNRFIAASLAWITTGGLLCGGATAAVTMREKIVETWPKTASFYAMAGMEVNRFGLEFAGVETQRSFDGTTPVLTIDGQVKNVSEETRKSPIVRIALLDEDGNTVHTEDVGLMEADVPKGETALFSARIVAPPMESFSLNLAFADLPKELDRSQNSSTGDGYAAGHQEAEKSYGHEEESHHEASHDSHSASDEHHEADNHDDTHH